MTEVQELLAKALTDLPGGPITTPAGLGVKARARTRRRRQVTIAASVVGMLAIGGGATVALRTAPVSHEAVGRPVPAFCVGQPALGPAPDGARPRHTAAQAQAALGTIKMMYARGARGATTLLQRNGALVWSVELLLVPGRGGLQRVLWLFPDADLTHGVRSVTCGLAPQLVGATVDPLMSAVDWSDHPGDLAVEPGTAPLPGESSLPWTVTNAGPDSRDLKVSYGTGCHENVRLQVEQAPAYVLLRVVRRGGPSSSLCLTGERGYVPLDAPLGQRLLLHAALSVGHVPVERVPSYLPDGTVDVQATAGAGTRTRVWQLRDGRHLTLTVGLRQPQDGPAHDTFVAGFAARRADVELQPDLQWEEQGTTLDLRLSRHADSVTDMDGPLLLRVAQSLYTQEYVGLTVDEARALASSYGLAFRVVRQDGRELGRTADLKFRRVNVAVDAGRVTAVESYS